ncbi:MAG: hypothetical protein ABIO24_04625, partial [Saprospiraceae bacterium]
ELSASPGTQVSNTPNFVAPNIGTGILQRGAGVAPTGAGGSISSTGWFNSAAPTTLAQAIANNEYYEFTLPINAGFKASITQVSVIVRASNTGPNTASLLSSADGFTATLGTIPITAASVLNNIPVALTNITGTLTFRLYGYGTGVTGTPGTGGTFRIGTSTVATDNDLIITGTTMAVCNLASAGLTNIHCEDNNNTPSTADDFIWFNLNPTGTGLGTTYNVTVNTGFVTQGFNNPPTNIPYGASIMFHLQGGSAGGGNVTVTVTDVTTGASCSISALIMDPGSCSMAAGCNLTGAGLANVFCNNLNESSSTTDDYISFDLNPVGMNLGTGYNVTSTAGTVSLNPDGPAATNVPYGSATNFFLPAGSAGGGNVTITVTDAVTGAACSIMTMLVDPGSCSGGFACSLTDSGISGLECNNNETSGTAADDYIVFFLDPTGDNLSGTYSVTVNTGTVTQEPSGDPAVNIPYGGATQFRLQNGSAGGGNVTVYITDDEDNDCVLSVPIVDPGSCSAPACSLMVSCPPQPTGTYDCNNPVPAAV